MPAFQHHVTDRLTRGAPLQTQGDYLANIAVEEAVYHAAAERRWLAVEPPSV